MAKLLQASIYEDFLLTTRSESPVQVALREKTVEAVLQHQMMTTPEQAQFLAFLIKRIGARSALEVGVFTGYGSLAIAAALPPEGRLVACDINDAWSRIGKPFWEAAGVANQIDLHVGPAIETLQRLLDQREYFDFIFVDADKIHYLDYFELSLSLLYPDGLIVMDNMLWLAGQKVADQDTPSARAIKALLAKVKADPRVSSLLVPLDKGMLLVQKA